MRNSGTEEADVQGGAHAAGDEDVAVLTVGVEAGHHFRAEGDKVAGKLDANLPAVHMAAEYQDPVVIIQQSAASGPCEGRMTRCHQHDLSECPYSLS